MSDGLRNGRIAAPNIKAFGWDPRTKAYRRQLFAKTETDTKICALCDKAALYRVYLAHGIGLGACKVHVAEVKAKAPYFGGK